MHTCTQSSFAPLFCILHRLQCFLRTNPKGLNSLTSLSPHSSLPPSTPPSILLQSPWAFQFLKVFRAPFLFSQLHKQVFLLDGLGFTLNIIFQTLHVSTTVSEHLNFNHTPHSCTLVIIFRMIFLNGVYIMGFFWRVGGHNLFFPLFPLSSVAMPIGLTLQVIYRFYSLMFLVI